MPRLAPMNAYPNPASNILNIELNPDTSNKSFSDNIKSSHQNFDIYLYDDKGSMLRHAKSNGENVQLNVSTLPNGFYYLHIYDGSGEKPVMQQIIVEH